MYCTHCGQPITDDAMLCASCGQPVQVAQPLPPSNSLYHVAKLGQRFVDYIVDGIVIYVILFLVALVDKGMLYFFLAIFITPIYYIVTENIWQRTVGKFVTGTKVVTFSGEKPAFWQIVGRSFARWIPFEAFSFFGGGNAGWHDTLAETLVVPNEYSPEQVRQIDLTPIRNRKHTWVIIAIAAVATIAIVGILSAVVLASLNTARQKGAEASFQSSLSSIRSAAEIYYSEHGDSYGTATDCSQGIFADSLVANMLSNVQSPACSADGASYAVSGTAKNSEDEFCADSLGYFGPGTFHQSADGTSVKCDNSVSPTISQ